MDETSEEPRLGPGARVGNLTIERELGRGGFAVVYLARDAILDRPVALKVLTLPPGTGLPEEERQSFLAEARIVAGFQSPHVVTLHHVHEHEGSGWKIEMEYVGGGSLRDRLRAGTGLPVSEVTDILCDVLRGLHAAHSRGVVHRDIEPENVLLDDDGVAKLADFGTAHVLGDQSLSTHSGGLIVGTPWYMAPEMLLGNTPSVASDLWSVGSMAYEMLTGETGIGKSAFVDELRLRAQQRGFRWVPCVASTTDGLLRSLVAALGAAYGDAIDDDDDAQELRAVLRGDPGAPLRTGVERLLERLCARTGVIVYVDDAHHLSKAEASLLCRLVRRFDVSRLGLLFVGRDEGCDLGAASADLRGVRSLVLTGLSTEALYQHLEHYAGGARVPAEVVKRIARVTDGNPLVAEQVFEHLVARDALRLESGVYVPVPGWESTELPGRFRDAAARRIEGIVESDRELLEIAAVDGREFDGNALAAVSGRPLLQVLRSLQALCRERAVLEPGDHGYRFRSGMLQTALYEELAPEMRRAIHASRASDRKRRVYRRGGGLRRDDAPRRRGGRRRTRALRALISPWT